MNSRIYTVAIIGAGRIGAGFDTPSSQYVLTHAHAFSKNKRTRVLGFVDSDEARGEREARKWGTRLLRREEMWNEKPDIVVIATPDATHASLVEESVHAGAKLVVCEKPGLSHRDMQKLAPHASQYSIVNFSNRFAEKTRALKAKIESEAYGKVLCASGIYTKGVLHNGSHMIDLARFLFRDVLSVLPLTHVRDWDGEPTVSAFLTFELCPQFHLMAGDERSHAMFELDMVFERGRFRIFDGGFMIAQQSIVRDPRFSEYPVLGAETVQQSGSLESLSNLASHAIDVLDGVTQSISTLENAARTYDACERLLE